MADAVPQPPENQQPQNGQPAEAAKQGEPIDWRIWVVIGLAVLFLVAVYVNRKYYSKPHTEPQPGRAGQQERPAEPIAPQLSAAEQYAMLVRQREIEAKSTLFSIAGKTTMLALPPIPRTEVKDGKELVDFLPGKMFDLSRLAEGVRPEMLHRRGAFGTTGAMAFMDTFAPLGLENGPRPLVKPAQEVTPTTLADDQLVIGLKVGDEARAYPVKMANHHDVINDTLGGTPIVVAWSALAGGAAAMERTLPDGTTLSFGSSGLIFQTTSLMYDAQSLSLWSPFQYRAIAGERTGTALKPLQTYLTTWQAWRRINPGTTVLVGTEPPTQLDYETNPALPKDYLEHYAILYPVYGFDSRKTPMRFKARVFGVTGSDGESTKAYEVGLLRAEAGKGFEDTIGGQKVTIEYDAEANILTARDAEGRSLRVETMFWLAWVGAHPQTEVWQEEKLRAAFQPASATPTTTTLPAP